MRVGGCHAPAALPPGKRLGTHCIVGWVDPRADQDGCGMSRPQPGFDPRTVQPVASRYTDCAAPAHKHCGFKIQRQRQKILTKPHMKSTSSIV
jgi:hypothetical protein